MPKLIFIDKDFAGRVYELLAEKTTVGRGGHNTLVIHHDSVSSNHCEILVHGPEVIVRDLGSSNGTYVQGTRLNNRQSQVKSGQIVGFGLVEARLELDPPQSDHGGEITAVHEMGRIMREQRREQQHPKPMDVSAKLEPITGAGSGEQTVLLRTATQPARPVTPPLPEKSGSTGPKTHTKTVLGILAALAVGLAILLALWWARK